jgi:hypothetical protein
MGPITPTRHGKEKSRVVLISVALEEAPFGTNWRRRFAQPNGVKGYTCPALDTLAL